MDDFKKLEEQADKALGSNPQNGYHGLWRITIMLLLYIARRA